MLGFCILSLKRLASLPDTESTTATLTTLGFLWLPLMYFLWTFYRSWYIRHRQPIIFIRKAVALAISTQYATSFYDSMHSASESNSPGLSLFMSSLGIGSQLLTHAVGFPNYGNWQLFSQAVGTAMAFRTAAVMCHGELANTIHRFVTSLPSFLNTLKANVAENPNLSCCIYCSGLHAAVGFIIATVLSNFLEFRHRRRFFASKFPNRGPLTLSDLQHQDWSNVLLIILMYIIMEGLNTAVHMAILTAETSRSR